MGGSRIVRGGGRKTRRGNPRKNRNSLGWRGMRGKGSTRGCNQANLRGVMMDIKEQQTRLGPNAVSFGWVKAHNEVHGSEMADQLAKAATMEEPETPRSLKGC